MQKFLLILFSVLGGSVIGAGLLTAFLLRAPQALGVSTSDGGLIGIYNATTTDVVLGDGYGSALATDSHGLLILTSP